MKPEAEDISPIHALIVYNSLCEEYQALVDRLTRLLLNEDFSLAYRGVISRRGHLPPEELVDYMDRWTEAHPSADG